MSKFIYDLIRELKSKEYMMVWTNKPNMYITMECQEYILEIEDSLAKVSNLINISSIKRFKVEAVVILETFKLEMN